MLVSTLTSDEASSFSSEFSRLTCSSCVPTSFSSFLISAFSGMFCVSSFSPFCSSGSSESIMSYFSSDSSVPTFSTGEFSRISFCTLSSVGIVPSTSCTESCLIPMTTGLPSLYLITFSIISVSSSSSSLSSSLK